MAGRRRRHLGTLDAPGPPIDHVVPRLAESVYRRYAIVSEGDLEDVAATLSKVTGKVSPTTRTPSTSKPVREVDQVPNGDRTPMTLSRDFLVRFIGNKILFNYQLLLVIQVRLE